MQQRYPSIFAKLARGFDPTSPPALEGFSSLHPIMHFKGWLDRRSEKRLRVNIPAVLAVNGVEQSVRILDSSESGFGLAQTSGLRVGDDVYICLAGQSGRKATVVWTKNDRAGVSLVE